MSKDPKSRKAVQSAVERLFALPKIEEPYEGEKRQAYVASASATFNSIPFKVLVNDLRDELLKLCALHDKETPSGDMLRGGLWVADQLHQRFEMLDAEHRQPRKEEII